MERALETQRLALLRLLAGLVFALAAVSRVPVVSRVPDWVRSYVSSVLVRAESAAASLVFVSACLLFGRRAVSLLRDAAFAPRPLEAVPEGGFPFEHLLHRIADLRAMLEDLPRYAKRLVKRRSKTAAVSKERWALVTETVLPTSEPFRARIDRPPDIENRLWGGF